MANISKLHFDTFQIEPSRYCFESISNHFCKLKLLFQMQHIIHNKIKHSINKNLSHQKHKRNLITNQPDFKLDVHLDCAPLDAPLQGGLGVL